MSRTHSLQDVAQHNSARYARTVFTACFRRVIICGQNSSCWVIISDKVYDVTDFLPVSFAGYSCDECRLSTRFFVQ